MAVKCDLNRRIFRAGGRLPGGQLKRPTAIMCRPGISSLTGPIMAVRLKRGTLLDEYTRQCLAIQVERQITAAQVLAVLEKAMAQYGAPDYIRSDNGPEFIAKKVQQGLNNHHIKAIYIDPGSPWQNGYIESFHSRFRDECLSRELLLNLREARVVIEDWRPHYNTERPHSRLGYLSPEEFINTKILTH